MKEDELWENRGLNVVFKAHGTLRDLLTHVHNVYGINKSDQAQYLLEQMVATELVGESQLDDYLRKMQGLLLDKLRAKRIDFEFQIELKQKEVDKLTIKLSESNGDIENKSPRVGADFMIDRTRERLKEIEDDSNQELKKSEKDLWEEEQQLAFEETRTINKWGEQANEEC